MTIVRANATLTAGGISVVKRNVTSQRDGSIVMQAEYVCLATFAARWTQFFVKGAPPPTGLPSSLAVLGASSAPTLFDVTTRTESGLTYFAALYSAANPKEVTITETEEQRNWSGVVQYNLNGGFVLFTTNYSFDYMSKSVAVTGRNTYPGERGGSVGRPFNRSFNFILNDVGAQAVALPKATTIVSRTKTQSSLGEFSYSTTSTGVYEL